MTATRLKYLACALMLMDHIAAVLMLTGGGWIADGTLFLMRLLGRLAFPIFAFFIAEGCQKTRDFPRYLKRLFLFSVVSQLPFSLAFETWGGSVILTFFLAAAGISLYQSAHETLPGPVAALPVLFMALMAQWLQSDYAWQGVLIVFFLYLCGENRRRRLVCLAGSMIFLYLVSWVLNVCTQPVMAWINGVEPALVWSQAAIFPRLASDLPFYMMNTVFACAALLPLSHYEGVRGTGNQWFFYWFYPAHLMLLFLCVHF